MTREDKLRLKVRWLRYATPELIIRAWLQVTADEHGVKLSSLNVSPNMLTSLKRERMWAFVDIRDKSPVVHYWHRADVPKLRLAFMLGHELGHAVGKPHPHHNAEEDRADTYGSVVHAVMRRLERNK